MRAQTLTPHTEAHLFPELHGFVLADPGLLDAFHGGKARGLDLLELYSRTEAGNRVAAEGIAIPVLGLEPAYYSVTFRLAEAASTISEPPIASSSGWILHIGSAEVIFGGIGYLKCWNPDHPKLRRIALPPGWYSVKISLGAASNQDDFLLDFALVHCSSRPEFTADIDTTPFG